MIYLLKILLLVNLFIINSVLAGGLFGSNTIPPFKEEKTPLGNVDKTCSPFHFTLDCPATMNCSAVLLTVYNAMNRLKLVVNLNTPIISAFSFSPLCPANKNVQEDKNTKEPNCMEPGVLGSARPSTNIPVLINNGNLIFRINNLNVGPPIGAIFNTPQALLQQWEAAGTVTVDDRSVYDNVAIKATFSSSRNWFLVGSGTLIRGQSDLEYVLVHEMLHGLGFGAGSLTLPRFYQTPINEKERLIPLSSSIGTVMHNLQFSSPSFWDAFVVDTIASSNWLTSYEEFNDSLRRAGITSLTTPKEIENIALTDNLSEKLAASRYKAATTIGGMFFAIRPTLNLPAFQFPLLTSIPIFNAGSSTSHIEIFSLAEEFLMRNETGSEALATHRAIEETYLKSGIGPLTARVLHTLGYNINGLPNSVVFEGKVVSRDNGLFSSFSTKSKYINYYIPILIVKLLLLHYCY